MPYRFDEYELDPDRLELRRFGMSVCADCLSVRLLVVLVENAGRLVSKAELKRRVWEDRALASNVISVAVTRLRKVLDGTGTRPFIVNLQGGGYRFVRPVVKTDPGSGLQTHSEPSSPFVGRKEPMGQLHASLADMRAGRGGICLLLGEVGIGKTRMLAEFAREAQVSEVSVAWAHCRALPGMPPLWPIAQLVAARLAILPAELRDPSGVPRAHRWLTYALFDESASHRIDTAHSRCQLLEAIADLFAQSAEHPCLFLLDDVHLADEGTQQFLEFWSDRIARSRILLVATALNIRALGQRADARLVRLAGHRNCRRIALERLDHDAITSYVAALHSDPGGDLAQAVWARSEGLPCFMVEALRAAVDPTAQPSDARCESEGVLAIFRPGILELDAASNGLLRLAAVIGRRFEVCVLRDVVGCTMESLMAWLDGAAALEVLTLVPDSLTAFEFSHGRFRDLLYGALRPHERRRLHQRVADVLAQRKGDGHVVSMRTIAHHLHAALPDSDPAQTLAACTAAVAEAADLTLYADAARHARRAREALRLRAEPSAEDALALALRELTFARLASLPEFARSASELVALARDQEDGRTLVEVALLSAPMPGFPSVGRARTLLERASWMLRPDDHAHRSMALARLATLPPLAFDAERSLQQVAEATRLARRASSPLARACCQLARQYLRGGAPDPDQDDAGAGAEARAALGQGGALGAAQALGDLRRAIVYMQHGDISAMARAIEDAAERSRGSGMPELRWHVERFQALARVHAGDTAGGRSALRALRTRAKNESILSSPLLCAHDAVVVLGESVADEDLRSATTPDPDDGPGIWSLKAHVLAASGKLTAAREMLARMPPHRLSELPRDGDYLGTLGALARTSIRVGARAHAEVLGELLQPYSDRFAVHLSFYCEGPIALLLTQIEAMAIARREALKN